MARKHVYPVCRPGARTYTLPRLSDLTFAGISSTGFFYYYQNNDRSIQVDHRLDSNHLAINFFEGKGNLSRELLFDLKSDDAQALRDDFEADLSSGSDFRWVFTETLYSMVSNAPKGYERLIGIHERNDTLSPGDIICIGHKIGVTADNSFSFAQGVGSYIEDAPLGYSKFKLPFVDDVYNYNMDAVLHTNQKWSTLMWSGTRFVLLGSNNWY